MVPPSQQPDSLDPKVCQLKIDQESPRVPVCKAVDAIMQQTLHSPCFKF